MSNIRCQWTPIVGKRKKITGAWMMEDDTDVATPASTNHDATLQFEVDYEVIS
jgi:hypothetical protein